MIGEGLQLVFVHGAGSNADFWFEQRAAFPDAVYLDLPGHRSAGSRQLADGGKRRRAEPEVQSPKSKVSDLLPAYRSVAPYAGWVAHAIEERGLEKIVLNGHSMGGAITQTLALRRPPWLRAVVLTGTGARLRVLPRLLELLRTDYSAAVDLIIADSFSPGVGALTYKQRVRVEGTRRQLLRTPQEVTLGDYEACDRFDIMDRVHEIELPTLCMVGAQDKMTPPKYSEYLHRQIKGARLEVIEAAGHMLPMEQPKEYNSRLVAFLNNLGV